MFSSEDEQDDRGIFDQLKSIKPFTIEQLYLLHPDVVLPPKSALLEADNQNERESDFPRTDKDIYQHLIEHESFRKQLVELRHVIKKLYKKTCHHIDDAWMLKEESVRKIAMCQQGKITETTFKFKQAHIDKRHLDNFSSGFGELIDLISKEYIYYSFETQSKRNKIATHLSISYQTPDIELRKSKLRSAIATLVDFIRYLGDVKSDFVIQCRKWFRALVKRLLESATTQDYRFVIAQLAKGPAGTADWSADLIECRPYEQVRGFDSVPQYISHCSILLSELFYNLQQRLKYVAASSTTQPETDQEDVDTGVPNQNSSSEQNWSLVDPRFSCTEELNISSSCGNLLSESDIVKYCLRIPVTQIFRAYVVRCLDSSNEFHLETDKNYEYIMLKLLTIGTIIIKTYQIGLETFNSIQYGNLIEYLSSQIRRTVITLSDQWAEFKNRLKGVDDALVMRLQVEYDSFMLRSILIILELRGSGIWRHLSRIEQDLESYPREEDLHTWTTDSLRPAFSKILQVTGITSLQQEDSYMTHPDQIPELIPSQKGPKISRSLSNSLTYEFSIEWFKEVSESMLWHILWQFHHNGFVSSCDYHSDSYWLEKFQEKSVVYLFVNKIRESPPGECSYLLNSITSMLLSRTRPDSKLVNFIATEIFNLTFKYKIVAEKVAKKGIKSLIRCAEKFPNLISLYLRLMDEQDSLSEFATNLIKGCSLNGWLFDEDEFKVLESWLIDYKLDSAQNKIARSIFSKVLVNSSTIRPLEVIRDDGDSITSEQSRSKHKRRGSKRNFSRSEYCFVHLKLRRRLALLLYNASIRHFPENTEFGSQSLGTLVEVALGAGLYCEHSESNQKDLSELSVESSYQQFYIWIWRVLFILRLHILNQPETDWNDVQSRSGTSRSIKNTVLINDAFHPVPSIDDSECTQLAEGLKKQNPVASFICLVMTDVTWQVNNLESCIINLNILSDSGHITPSLVVMKYVTVCHLNDLTDVLAKDKNFIEYFTTIILSNFDSTRLSSLIATQLDHLKQYRQLQLSHFYVGLLLEVNLIISKRVASSWFTNNEISFEKIAFILDFIVRFNFATQRFEIVRKFYDCAYAAPDQLALASQTNSWLGSLFTATPVQRELLTSLHILSYKFKKYIWLQWITTECDTLRLEKVWEDIVVYLSSNEEANLDQAIKKVCPNMNSTSLKSTLPIYSWIRQIFAIMEQDPNHPLYPLIWYNFFLNYFSNSLNGVSVGYKLVSPQTITKLLSTLDELCNYHLFKQRYRSTSKIMQPSSLTQLYKAYKLWLQDTSLREAYIDIDRLKDDYLVHLLKAVMESSNASVCLQFIDLQSIEVQNKNLMQIWLAYTQLITTHSDRPNESIVCLEQHEQSKDDYYNDTCDHSLANDAISLLTGVYESPVATGGIASKSLDSAHGELCKPLSQDYLDGNQHQTAEELMDAVKKNFTLVFEESNVFGLNVAELDRTKNEIIELVKQLYTNEKREYIRVVPCAEGNECIGPARIKMEVEEALMDERKSQCIQDRRRQCQELIGELLLMPKNRTVLSTVIIEENIRKLVREPGRSKIVIESLLSWLSEPNNYNQLNGSYYEANHLLKTALEILSTSDQVDTFNTKLIDVCLKHPESIQIFSPYLSPSACSDKVFLELYKTICTKQTLLGPNATFVLLSKFDLSAFLGDGSRCRDNLSELIINTCGALKEIGKDPEDLTMDLFKRHLEIELAPGRRKSIDLIMVFKLFLDAMSEQKLAPSLWTHYLAIIGFEISKASGSKDSIISMSRQNPQMISSRQGSSQTSSPHQSCDINSIASLDQIAANVAQFADCQASFDLNSLTILIKTMCEHIKEASARLKTLTPLVLYQDYLDQVCIVMFCITIMWLKAMCEIHPESIEFIWEQYLELWHDWVFIRQSIPNGGKQGYNLVVNYFVISSQYIIHKLPDSTELILQLLLSKLCSYILESKEAIYLELNILQRCLKNLPWSNVLATPVYIENLARLSEQKSYNISDLISHIIFQINIKESLGRISEQESDIMSSVTERLAKIIIIQSNHLKGFKIYGNHLSTIRVERIPELSSLALAHTEFVNLEHNHNNKLLISLMRAICIDGPNQHRVGQQQQSFAERLERSINYARFISNYLVDLITRHPASSTHSQKYLELVIDNSIADLASIMASPKLDAHQKTMLYASLLDFCDNQQIEQGVRLQLAQNVVDSNPLKGKSKLMVDMVFAISQFIKDCKVLVKMVEALIDSCNTNNDINPQVWTQFRLKSVPEDIYLNTCVQERAPLAITIYLESLFHAIKEARPAEEHPVSDSNQIWCKFFYWLAQLTQALGSATGFAESLSAVKLTSTWIQLLIDLEPHLEKFLVNSSNSDQPNGLPNSSKPNLCTEHKHFVDYTKQLIGFYDSISFGGLWSYLKLSSNKSVQSSKMRIVALAIACFLSDRAIIEINKIKTDLLPHLIALREELTKLRRICLVKLEAARKSKNMLDSMQFIETLIESVQQNDKVQFGEGVQLIRTYARANNVVETAILTP